MKRLLIPFAVSLAALSLNAMADAGTIKKPVAMGVAEAKDRPADAKAQKYAGDKMDHHAEAGDKGGHPSSIGKPGTSKEVTRTVKVNMDDAMRFNPSQVSVKRGQTIRFVLNNSGKLKHEMVLGSMQELTAHAEMMRKMPEMEHADENMVSVDPGKSGELIWEFTNAGKFHFACLQPGHFEAGMKGQVAVK